MAHVLQRCDNEKACIELKDFNLGPCQTTFPWTTLKYGNDANVRTHTRASTGRSMQNRPYLALKRPVSVSCHVMSFPLCSCRLVLPWRCLYMLDYAPGYEAGCMDLAGTWVCIGELLYKLEIAQSEQDVSPFCKESDMTYIVESVSLDYFCDSKMSCR